MTAKMKGKRFANVGTGAKRLGKDISTISRRLADGKIQGGEYDVFIKVDDIYFPVDGSTVKVIDLSSVE